MVILVIDIFKQSTQLLLTKIQFKIVIELFSLQLSQLDQR